ncbi:hypothetical protein ALE3EI_2032 [Constantimarinum furrinae]|uniref:tRNA (Guanine-N1)-methyltransferase n=2 Tax=Constantimarinum furrinae TaxID=2562285 RepID=A0A7G8PW63_9FLAO|nr:hypothetical protein ALE3EI_2032 [Constantimarinum furrinae]
MKKNFVLVIGFLCLHLAAFAQEDTAQDPPPNTVEQQFIDVVDGSNSYQEFKVIKKTEINGLRKSVLDSIKALETNIDSLNSQIGAQKNDISKLQTDLNTVQQDLSLSKQKEDGIEFFGVLTQKSTYNSIMWSIIGLLVLALAFFIYKFNNSNKVTQESQLKLAELEIEFEKYRQKAIENEQQLGRKLQDEINKNRKG